MMLRRASLRVRAGTLLGSVALGALGCTGELTGESALEAQVEAATVDDSLAMSFHPQLLSATGAGSCAGLALGIFDGVIDASPFADVAAEPCVITLELSLPDGLQVGFPSVTVQVAPSALGEGSKLVAAQRFVGRATLTRALPLDDARDVEWSPASDRRFLSPSCGETSRVQYELSIRAQDVPTVALDRVLIETGYEHGVRVRRCGGDNVVPSASGEGGFCGGPPSHPCAPDLLCERSALGYDPALPGRCVRSDEAPEPVGLRELCDGPRDVPCDTGLVCSHVSSASAAQPLAHGVCLRERGGEGDDCGGHAQTACVDDLVCWRSDYQDDGAYGVCRALSGRGADDVCAGTPTLTCADDLVCVTGVCRRTDGSLDAMCGRDGLSCQQELTCFRQRCRDFRGYPEVGAGEECGPAVQRACTPPLTCDLRAVCR